MMDVAKKERWRQRDARRKEKKRNRVRPVVAVDASAINTRDHDRLAYFALRPQLHFATPMGPRSIIDSAEYKVAIAATQNMTELREVRRSFGIIP